MPPKKPAGAPPHKKHRPRRSNGQFMSNAEARQRGLVDENGQPTPLELARLTAKNSAASLHAPPNAPASSTSPSSAVASLTPAPADINTSSQSSLQASPEPPSASVEPATPRRLQHAAAQKTPLPQSPRPLIGGFPTSAPGPSHQRRSFPDTGLSHIAPAASPRAPTASPITPALPPGHPDAPSPPTVSLTEGELPHIPPPPPVDDDPPLPQPSPPLAHRVPQLPRSILGRGPPFRTLSMSVSPAEPSRIALPPLSSSPFQQSPEAARPAIVDTFSSSASDSIDAQPLPRDRYPIPADIMDDQDRLSVRSDRARPPVPRKPDELRRPRQYSRQEYIEDAAHIVAGCEARDHGEGRHLHDLIPIETEQIARAVLMAIPSMDLAELTGAAEQAYEARVSPMTNSETARAIITKFMQGPQSPSPEAPPRQRPRIPQGRPVLPADQYGAYIPSPRPRPAQPHLAGHVYSPPGFFPRHHQRHRRQDSAGSQDSYRVARPHRSHKTLKPELFAFDSTKTPVSTYLNQVDYLAQQYGEEEVLALIGVGILLKPESDGAQWFGTLTVDERLRLGSDLQLWRELLLRRFQKDRGAMMLEADSLVHSFASEDSLPLQTYIDRKIRLYNEAGTADEDTQCRRIVMGLDPALAALLSLDPQRPNSLSNIRTQIASKEHAARANWKNTQDALKTTMQDFSRDRRPRDDNRRQRRQPQDELPGRDSYSYRNRYSDLPRRRDRSRRRRDFREDSEPAEPPKPNTATPSGPPPATRSDDNRLDDGRRDNASREDDRREDDRREDDRRDTYRRQDGYRRQDDRRDKYRRQDGYQRQDDRRDNYRRDDYRRDNYRRDTYRRQDGYQRQDDRRDNPRRQDEYQRRDDRAPAVRAYAADIVREDDSDDSQARSRSSSTSTMSSNYSGDR